MANSKYEYVKQFEVEDEVMLPNLIVVQIHGCDFHKFSDVHEFQRPNDEQALNLMNACAVSVLEEYPDIVFAYGFSSEYSFVLKKLSKFYQRRASKILSLIISFFTSVYAAKWKEFFPQKELRYPPLFQARVIQCATMEVLQHYLAWRQRDCHLTNQYNTCLWKLVKCGETEKDAREKLKGTQKKEKNELLFQQFGINYKTLPEIFRQGSCVLKAKVEDVVKYGENGNPIKRLRRKAYIIHSENISGRVFWNEHPGLLNELGGFAENIAKIDPDYVRSFQFDSKLMPSTWIVVRIDGCHFHRFCEIHEFEKPNDKLALELMNSCAVALLQEFQDIIFAYGVSDEYSFILKRILSYTKGKPGHINNQYNTCFWMLVKSGKSKSEAQHTLKGTQSQEKYELLAQQFAINYSTLPAIFRLGSSVFREDVVIYEKGSLIENLQNQVVVKHCNIIDSRFWKEHPIICD